VGYDKEILGFGYCSKIGWNYWTAHPTAAKNTTDKHGQAPKIFFFHIRA
jgi:hypothetical protein